MGKTGRDSTWDWDGVYPYYRRSSHFTPANSGLRAANASIGRVDDAASFASNGGPLQVSYPNFAQPWSSSFPQGFEEVGILFLPQGISSGNLDGYASITLTIDPTQQTRSSSETSFLRTALAGTDIVVYTHALAKRILSDQVQEPQVSRLMSRARSSRSTQPVKSFFLLVLFSRLNC